MSRSDDLKEVTLQELTHDNFKQALKLKVAPDQQEFVAPNAASIAEARFYPRGWFRGIYAADSPVGFIMLDDPNLNPGVKADDNYFLWRLMIDQHHQRKVHATAALNLLIEHISQYPDADQLYSSYVPGDSGPENFYLNFGFRPTGHMEQDEIEIVLDLS